MQATASSGESASPRPSSGAPAAATAEAEGRQDAGNAQEPAGRKSLTWARNRWVIMAAGAAVMLVLFLAYAAQARTLAATSESSAQALQAWDMLHGNVLLRGWTLSDVTFYTTEIPEYLLVEFARGLSGGIVHVAAGLTYMLLVVLAGVVAAGRSTGRERLIRLVVVAVIMLAPALRPGTYLLLSAPDHLGTQVPLLLVWLVLDRMQARWWVPLVVGLALTWAQVSDVLVLYEGVVPLAIVCVVRMYRRRGPLAGQWYELALAGAALASAVVSRLAIVLIRATPAASRRAGCLSASRRPTTCPRASRTGRRECCRCSAPISSACRSAPAYSRSESIWRGLAWSDGPSRWESGASSPTATWSCRCSSFGFVALLAGYLVSNKGAVNEIVGLLQDGAVLAGRVLSGRLQRSGLVPALAILLVCSVGILGFDATRPPARSTDQLAVSWLEAHHLTYGLAGYWQASSVTGDSGDRVQVRPVRMYARGLATTPSRKPRHRGTTRGCTMRGSSFLASAAACHNVCLSRPACARCSAPAGRRLPRG